MSHLGEPRSKTKDQLIRDARYLVDEAKPRGWREEDLWSHLEELLHRLEQEEIT